MQSGIKALGVVETPVIGKVSSKIKMMYLPKLVPRDKEVLVKVYASAINLDDILLTQGTSVGRLGGPKPSSDKPYVPGMDFSGVVMKVGNKVRNFREGDDVFGMILPQNKRGAWAVETCVHQRYLCHKPKEIDFLAAATISTSGIAAYVAVTQAHIQQGHHCLVIGASGGIGSLITQILKSQGVYVVGVCSAKSVDMMRSQGADAIIDYTQGSFGDALLDSKTPCIDRVFDCIGGKDTEMDALRVLKRNGEFVTLVGPEKYIGQRKMTWPEFLRMIGYMFYRTITSNFVGPKYRLVSTPQSLIPAMLSFFREHNIQVVIDQIIPFEESAVRAGIERVYSRHTQGKTIIRISLPETL